MKLWKIADRREFLVLENKGRLVADGKYVDRNFRAAYRWMAQQMVGRIGPGPDGVSFPQWAWLHWRGISRKRPDLRNVRYHLPRGCYFLLELEIDQERVLVSDFERWHFVLNGWHLPCVDEDTSTLARVRPRERAAAIEKSWDAIFNTSGPLDEALWGSPDGWSLQATFWELNRDDVDSTFPFESALA